MRAMLHYALLKSVRERSLFAFLLGPFVLIGAPLLGFLAEAVHAGRPIHPLTLAGMSVADFERAMSIAAAAAAVAVAGAAAFWCFRADLANRSLSFFLLGLRRPVVAPVAAAAFGWCAGLIAFLATIPLMGSVTGRVSRVWLVAALVVAIAGAFTAAIGTTFAAYAPAPGTLAMVAIVGTVVTFAVMASVDVSPVAWSIVWLVCAAVLLLVAGRAMERRCAA